MAIVLVKPRTLVLNWSNPITKNLVLDATFIERGGTTTTDAVAKRVGTLSGTVLPSWITGLLGTGLSFNGTNGQTYIDYADAAWNSITGPITMEAYVYVNQANANCIVLGKPVSGTSHDSPYFAHSIHFLGDGTARFWVVTSGGTISDCNFTYAAGYYHFVGVYDGSTVKVYANGVLRNSKNMTGTFTDYATPLRIGTNGGKQETFNGKIFYARMWNRGLSALEIKSLYVNPWRIYKRLILQLGKAPTAGTTIKDIIGATGIIPFPR